MEFGRKIRMGSSNSKPDSEAKKLIKILGLRSNAEIEEIKSQQAFKEDLEKYLAKNTSGDLKKLLLALLEANRDESCSFDDEQIKDDAETLYDLEIEGINKESCITILTKKNLDYLKEVFKKYKNHSPKCNTPEGDLQKTFEWLVECIEKKPL